MDSDEIVYRLQSYGVVYVLQAEGTKNFSAQCTMFLGGMKSVVKVFHHKTMKSALQDLYDTVLSKIEEDDE